MLTRKVTRWSVFLVLTLWLAVVAPGHQRGMIRTDGPKTSNSAKHSCCQTQGDDQSPEPKKEDPARHCAVCYLNATLDLPPVIDLTPRYLGLVERIEPPGTNSLHVIVPDLPFHGRAPPLS